MIANLDPETTRGLFVLAVLFVLSLGITLSHAYRLGRQRGLRDYLRTHFTATLRPDDSVKQRL